MAQWGLCHRCMAVMGTLSRVYVMGGAVAVARRPTLQLSAEGSPGGGVEHVERVSAYKEGYSKENDSNSSGEHPEDEAGQHSQQRPEGDSWQPGQQGKGAAQATGSTDEPPEWVVKGIAHALQKALGLQLFNFDMLRPVSPRDGSLYHVVDINYFPGYEKLPHHTERFTSFLAAIISGAAIDGRLGPESYCSCVQMPSEGC